MAYGYSYKPPKIPAYGGLKPEGFNQLATSVPPAFGDMLTAYYPSWAAPGGGAAPTSTVPRQAQDPSNSYTGGTGSLMSESPQGSGHGTPPSLGGPSGGAGSPWANDPILLKQEALDAKMVADAEAGALAQRKTSLINYGDENLANSVLHDPNTALAAKNNQFSTLAQLLNQYTQGNSHMNEALNDHNLFFSSTRVNDLVNSGKAYQGQKYGAAGQVQGVLGQIANALLQAKYSAQQNDLNAEEAAYMRYLQSLLQNQAGAPPTAPPSNPYTAPSSGTYNLAGLTAIGKQAAGQYSTGGLTTVGKKYKPKSFGF